MTRKICLDRSVAVARIIEDITNQNDVEKVFNVVQHATLDQPFLDESTIVDTKVDSKFNQEYVKTSNPTPDQIIGWLEAYVDVKTRDLRHLKAESDYDQVVVKYILNKNDENGWIIKWCLSVSLTN